MFQQLEALFEVWRGCGNTGRSLVTLFTLSGTICVTFCLLRLSSQLIKGFRLYVYSQLFSSKNDLKKYGKWAVVTGATDGIGRAMAVELAMRGFSLVVVGRNREKLDKTKLCLEVVKNVGEVITVQIDLFDSSMENYERIRGQIDADNRDIGILINNAGVFDGQFAPYHLVEMEKVKNMVNINVLAVLYFTHMILPGMISRKRGLIVNVSSGIGEIESAYMNVYGPTKTFVNAFSRSLQIEYASKPIDIINLTTGPVMTNIYTSISKITKPSFVSTPDAYARSVLNAAATLIPSYSGTLSQALLLQVSLMAKRLGLVPCFIRLFLHYGARKRRVWSARRERNEREGEKPA